MTFRLRTALRWLRLPLHSRDALRRVERLHAGSRRLEEVVEASIDLGSRGLVKVKAQQRLSEILGLARAVAELEPRNILEIGTARGGTLLVWAHLASERVITCDLLQPGYRRKLYARMVPPGSACRIVPLCGDSHTTELREQVERELSGDPVDFLFIDGDHSEAGVTADFESYRPLVRPGGLVAFHDIAPRQPFPDSQVHRLWERLREKLDTEELIDDPEQVGFGIGLVRVR